MIEMYDLEGNYICTFNLWNDFRWNTRFKGEI